MHILYQTLYTAYMARKLILGSFIVLLLVAIGYIVFRNIPFETKRNLASPTNEVVSEKVTYPLEASFEIYTNGTKRDFSANMYHELDPKAYIDPTPPYNIVIANPGTTWQEFFDTLPFSLSEDCLTTGTGQTFCNSSGASLHFYLNGVETETVLTEQIRSNDRLIIKYE